MPRRSRRAARRLRNPSRRLCERDRRQQSEENADDDPNFSHSSSSSSRSALNGCSASANSKHGKNARQEVVVKKSGLHQRVRKRVGGVIQPFELGGRLEINPTQQREAGRAARPFCPSCWLYLRFLRSVFVSFVIRNPSGR